MSMTLEIFSTANAMEAVEPRSSNDAFHFFPSKRTDPPRIFLLLLLLVVPSESSRAYERLADDISVIFRNFVELYRHRGIWSGYPSFLFKRQTMNKLPVNFDFSFGRLFKTIARLFVVAFN